MRVVVSGYRRTGTSAMMCALVDSLVPPFAVGTSNDDWGVGNVPDEDGYIPCPGPLFEVGGSAYCNAQFLRNMPNDVLIKIFFDGLPNLPAGEYVVIWMYRDPEEVAASLERAEKHIIDWALKTHGTSEEKTKQRNARIERTFCVYRDYNQDDIDHVLGIVDQRKDIRLIEVDYADLIANPRKVFKRIKKHLDIDIDKAMKAIKPEFYRARKTDDDSKDRNTGRAAASIDTANEKG